MKKIQLELTESVYDAAKKEVRKEYKRWHFTNLIFPIMFCIMVAFSFLIDRPSSYDAGERTCDYMITTMNKGTWYFTGNSNPNTGEIQEVIKDDAVVFLRQMTCEGERD